MKKFSKKLSLVLVLAMIVGLFSGAMGASASSWSFKAGKMKVKVDGTVALSVEAKRNFDLYKDGKLVTEKADAADNYTVVWSTSDDEVVKVDATNGWIRGLAEGEATVTANITNTKSGAKTTKSFDVVVEDIVLTATAGDEALKVGETYVLSSATTGYSFNQTGLYRAYSCADENVTIAKKDGKNTITATKAGTYKVDVVAASSQKNADAGKNIEAKATIEVIFAADDAFEIKQISSKKFSMTFGEGKDLSKVTTADVKVFTASKEDGYQFSSGIKSVSAKDNVLTVELYTEMTKDNFVFASYKDGDQEAFKVSKGDVVKVVLDSAAVPINTPFAMGFKLYDAADVEIEDTALRSKVTFARKDTTGYHASVTGGNILFWGDLGKTATVVATFHTYKYDTTNGSEIVIESNEATYTSVDAMVYEGAEWAVTTETNKDKVTWGANEVAIGESAAYLVGKFTQRKADGGTETKYANLGSPRAAYSGLVYTSTVKDVLLIDSATGKLVPLKTGSTDIIITKGNVTVGGFRITVLPARKAATLVATADKQVLSRGGSASDKIEVKLAAKDQYDKAMDVNLGDLKLKNVQTGAEVTLQAAGNFKVEKNKLIISGAAFGADGNQAYEISVKDSTAVAWFSFDVKNPGNTGIATNTAKLVNIGEQDLKVTANTAKAFGGIVSHNNGVDVTNADEANVVSAPKSILVAEYDQYGVKIDAGQRGLIERKIDSTNPQSSAVATPGTLYVTINTPAGGDAFLTLNSKNLQFIGVKAVASNSGGVVSDSATEFFLKKAPTGTYSINLYKAKEIPGTGTSQFDLVDSISFNVKDTQDTYSVAQNYTTSTISYNTVVASKATMISNLFDAGGTAGKNLVIKLGNNPIAASAIKDITVYEAKPSLVCVKVLAREEFDFLGDKQYYLDREVTVGKTIDFAN